jgi:hypothetical protein
MGYISNQAEAAASDPTLASLRALLRADTSLSEAHRADMLGALNAVARAFRLPLESIPADPARLRPMLSGITPAMAGVSVGRWQNIRSALGKAMALLHGDVLPRRLDQPASERWAACLVLLGKGAGPRLLLMRLARYATRLEIEPEAVDDAVIARYHDALIARRRRGTPGKPINSGTPRQPRRR